MKLELLDPFGAVIASGDLAVADVPGIDEHTPSVAEEIAQRFTGHRIVLADWDAYSGHPYSIRVS